MEFNVKIVRSKRKTISISVLPNNEITLRCPLRTSEGVINNFIERKRGWINNVLARNEIKNASNKSVLEYREIYVKGNKVPLIISDLNKITDSAVYVKNLKSIKKVFISDFSDEFINFAKSLSLQTGLHANSFNIKAYKRRWGCCDLKGKISFNYMLLMLPLRLQRYVIIHELCHTVHFNHSAEFWRLVSEFEPDYKSLKAQLKTYDYVTILY